MTGKRWKLRFYSILMRAVAFGTFGAILQAAVPPGVQGRVFSARHSLELAVAPLGLAVFGPLGDLIGPQPILVIGGVAVIGMVGVFVAVAGVRELEEGPPDHAASDEAAPPRASQPAPQP